MQGNETLKVQPEIRGAIEVHEDKMPDTGQTAWRVEAAPAGGTLVFHGEAPHLGEQVWSDTKYLIVPVLQNTDHSLWLNFRFWGATSDSDAAHASIAIGVFPGFLVQVVIPLSTLRLQTLFPPRKPGSMKTVCTGTPVDPAQVTKFSITVPASAKPQTVLFGAPLIADCEPTYSIPKTPVVDELGQWNSKDWAGKTRGIEELKINLQRWHQEKPMPLPGPFDRFGGWTGRQYEATGFFRTKFDEGRWWLVDPDGHPFFSVGPDCIEPACNGPVTNLESLFAWLPPHDGEFADAWSDVSGRGAFVSYSIANLIRAFGDRWHERWYELTEARLRHWGFNTIGNWSEPNLGRRFSMPYVTRMGSFPTTKHRIFRDLPDVFSPEYAASAAVCAETLRETLDDPYLIGYFLTNEPNWAFGDYNLGAMVLNCAEPLSTRDKLVEFLSDKYDGDIASLTAAWKIPVRSWEDLHKPFERESSLSQAALQDLAAFSPVIIDEYVRIPAEAARRVDTNHLCLGLRWAWIASDAFFAGSRYCDVFSINCYQMRPDAAEIAKTSKASGLPVMIGEFHAGSLDVGLPANALRGVESQAARGDFYRYYVENAAAIPELVGAHYFQYGDQPVLGRFDGECLNIGLVDVCHKPYYDMISVIAQTHMGLYEVCSGSRPPTNMSPTEMPREGF